MIPEYVRVELANVDWSREEPVHRQMLQLKRIDYYRREALSEYPLHMDVEEYRDMFMQRNVTMIKASIYGTAIQSLRFPKNWKEAFKERWFPQWALKRYPVVYEEITLDVVMPGLQHSPHSPQLRAFRTGDTPYEDNTQR